MLFKYSSLKALVSYIKLGFSCALIILCFGCASIAGESVQEIKITSNPSSAQVVITDERGQRVFTGSTPVSSFLAMEGEGYAGKKLYTVHINKPGYQIRRIDLLPRANAWYVLGNFVNGLIFGAPIGFLGYLVVDPMMGKMFTLSPLEVEVQLKR